MVGRSDPWGIATFTGRSATAATVLAAQDGLYTLLVRGPEIDRAEVVSSISRAIDGADTAAFTACLADPQVRVLTLTVTEAGYCRGTDGGLVRDDPLVAADLATLAAGNDHPLRTAPGRVVAGLRARRRADVGPIALVPCDNLTGNGNALRRVIQDFAERADPTLLGWIGESVSFVSTAVDRITPRSTAQDRDTVAALTGCTDHAVVVTEPFREWVFAGQFPGGRPPWEEAGARFVDDLTPYEHRKLWLLNGAHSLLAYGGLLRGHTTVAQAIADDTCYGWVHEWWTQAAHYLPQSAETLAEYRAQLTDRFANPRMRHRLAQIAADGTQKLPMRTVPILRRERAGGRRGLAALRTLAHWIAYLHTEPADLVDPLAERLRTTHRTRDLLAILDPDLACDDSVVADLDELVSQHQKGLP